MLQKESPLTLLHFIEYCSSISNEMLRLSSKSVQIKDVPNDLLIEFRDLQSHIIELHKKYPILTDKYISNLCGLKTSFYKDRLHKYECSPEMILFIMSCLNTHVLEYSKMI